MTSHTTFRPVMSDLGLELEETSIDVALPTDRPLFTALPAAEVNSLLVSMAGDY